MAKRPEVADLRQTLVKTRGMAARFFFLGLACVGASAWAVDDRSHEPAKTLRTAFMADSARETWRLNDLQDYRFDVSWICYCATSGRFLVTVRDGSISEVTSAEADVHFDAGQAAEDLPTVGGLFDAIDRFMDDRPDAIELRLDRYLGYPARFRVDPRYGVADDELSVTIHSLSPVIGRQESAR